MAVPALLVFAALVFVGVALAAATNWSTNGPNWNGTNWVLTGTVTLTGPDRFVCMTVTVPSGPNQGSFTVYCPTGGNFTCTVSGSSVASSQGAISWQLDTYRFYSQFIGCLVQQTSGPSGTFAPNGTGPNAVTLQSLSSSQGPTGLPSLLIGAALLATLAMVATATTFLRRSLSG